MLADMNESNYIIAHWFVSDIKQSRVSKINRITFEIFTRDVFEDEIINNP